MSAELSRDDRIVAALDLLTARLRAGEPTGVDSLLAEDPDIADEVRALWGTIVVAENLGRPSPPTLTADSHRTMPPSAPVSPSQLRIAGYDIHEEIGRGGMGIVYRARQLRLDRWCALKVLLHGDVSTPENLQRFRTEAEATARLDHPHIVRVFEVGADGGHPFYSMPLINGTTLARRIADAPLAGREAATLLVPVCRAVAYANDRGILHRDLKPSNILLDERGHPYVSDFGLAKRFLGDGSSDPPVSLTDPGAIVGTPGYMSPEQAAGRRRDMSPASDVYSLGAILYACVTGRPPFQAASPVDALLMILEQDPPPPRLLNPRIDVDLEMILLKALQKPADLRYETADQLADDLQAWLNNEPVSARSSRFTQVLSRAFRPTHHIGVLENWGKLWMLHAAVVLVLCILTDVLKGLSVTSRWPYLGIWTLGLGAWAAIFWNLRRRSGPVTFVERQIAHIWAASMACSTALFGIEALLGLPVLTLSPVLALFAGAVFIAKAGILSGEFYLHAALLFAASIAMALFPSVALTIFGAVSGAAFFVTGWKYHVLQRGNDGRG